MFDMEKTMREEVRWRILAMLNIGRPSILPETFVLSVLVDLALTVTPAELRRALDYLERRKLLTIQRKEQLWCPELTQLGIDIAEYAVPCEPGIARPPKSPTGF